MSVDQVQPGKPPARTALAQAPQIDYLARDFTSFRQLLLEHLSVLAPQWTEQSPADVGQAIVDILAYAADYLSYFQDAVATEAYLGTARRRRSIKRHTHLLDYRLHEGCNARVWVAFEVARPVALPRNTVLVTQVEGHSERVSHQGEDLLAARPHVFEVMHDQRLTPERNRIVVTPMDIRTPFLDIGSTEARLISAEGAGLKAGDVLVLEDERSPDMTRKQAVRLTSVSADSGGLRVAWSVEDALTFQVFTGAMSFVARANVVLADHGQTVEGEKIPPPPPNARFRPEFRKKDITHATLYDPALASTVSARETLSQDPSEALAAVKRLYSVVGQDPLSNVEWTLRRDLFDSDRYAADFQVEVEEDRRCFLRFGFGGMGRLPAASEEFKVTYRFGNGSFGNIGPDAIRHIISDQLLDQDFIRVWNPLPGQGGTEPDSVEAARLHAPFAARVPITCVTTDDYAAAAAKFFDVEHSMARVRLQADWPSIIIHVQRRRDSPVDAQFRQALLNWLEQFRLAGTSLEIKGPHFVQLDIRLVVYLNGMRPETVVRDSLERAFSAELEDGFFYPRNFDFGQPVYRTEVVARALAVEGIGRLHVEKFDRLLPLVERNTSDAATIPIGPTEIVRCNFAGSKQFKKLAFQFAGVL